MGVGEGSVCVSAKHGVGERGVRLTSRVGLFVNSYFGLSRCCFYSSSFSHLIF